MTDNEKNTGNTPAPEPAAASEAASEVKERVTPEQYESRGKTVVFTPRGRRFLPLDKGIPVITNAGVTVTADQADALVEESEGLVQIKKEEK